MYPNKNQNVCSLGMNGQGGPKFSRELGQGEHQRKRHFRGDVARKSSKLAMGCHGAWLKHP